MMIVEAIPILADNYVWALHDGRSAVLVDPGDAPPILAWLEARGIVPSGILVTHHHWDHVGGLPALLDRFPVPVFGPTRGAAPSRPVADGDILDLPGLPWQVRVIDTPGHTRDHVCFAGEGHLFCGDTLFSCGCGRAFEGDPPTLYASLSRLMELPGETQVHCAHEYTLANLDFALDVEPDNPALQARDREARALRRTGQPTLPVSLARERETNPFLRCHLESVRVAASQHTGRALAPGAQTFAAVRAWKDEE
ncbi:MAG: hydroxyacylglutathione hydrolase [Pseudomonadota bacterium]